MKEKIFFSVTAILLALTGVLMERSWAQNVGIGTLSPDQSALLDIQSNAKGMLIPRVALQSVSDGTTIPSPAFSLLVYNLNSGIIGGSGQGYYYNAGTPLSPDWVPFLTNSPNAPGAWSLTGNSGTSAGTNFIGTTDAVDWVVKTSNAERMRVDTSGDVGIGTSSPTYKLHISASSNPQLRIEDVGGANALTIGEMGDYGGMGLNRDNITGTAFNSNKARASIFMYAVNNESQIHFATNNTNASDAIERMRIDKDGNVGIGTTSPGCKLAIDNVTSQSTDGLLIRSADGHSLILGPSRGGGGNNPITQAGDQAIIFTDGTLNGNGNLVIAPWASTTSGIRITSTGNVGIGTTAPASALHVYGGAAASQISLSRANSFAAQAVWRYNSANNEFGTLGNDNVSFLTNNTSRIFIEAGSGNIGIGITNPDRAFCIGTLGSIHVRIASSGNVNNEADIRFTDRGLIAAEHSLNFSSDADGDGIGSIIFTTGGETASATELMRIQPNGNIGIGTAGPTQLLDVNGNARVRAVASGPFGTDIGISGNGTLQTSSSDRRLKTDIEPLANSLEKVLSLQGVSYRWKENPDTEKKDIGMIAQDVEPIIPEVVFTNKTDGYLGINYSRFTAIFVEAFKEQQIMVNELKKENEAIKLQLDQQPEAYKEQQKMIEELKKENSAIKLQLEQQQIVNKEQHTEIKKIMTYLDLKSKK